MRCDAMDTDTDTDTDPIRIGYGSEKYLDIRERVMYNTNKLNLSSTIINLY